MMIDYPPNTYPGRCAICKQPVPANAGYRLPKTPGMLHWPIVHAQCVPSPGQVVPVQTASAVDMLHQLMNAVRNTPPPEPRLVVFFGPIREQDSPDRVYLDAGQVLDKHLIGREELQHVKIDTFGPGAAKAEYEPRPGDFVIGPRFSTQEYIDAATALDEWLKRIGIRLRS